MTQKHETFGAYRVGLSFNPSGDKLVDTIKAYSATLIDAINLIEPTHPEQARLKALALTAVEEASMWAVKSQTKKDGFGD